MTALEVRPVAPEDFDALVRLLRLSLGVGDDPAYDDFLDWKHRRNSFGPSFEWVATSGSKIVGYRAFMRWRFTGPSGRVDAVRAVDTATHPEHQGRGIFRTLTEVAVEHMAGEGVGFVFNTPNDQSRPGYLKMGWRLLGRVPVRVRPALPPRPRRLLSARAAADRFGESVLGYPEVDATRLRLPADPNRLHTQRTDAFLAWRYGLERLGYRMAALDGENATAVFRVRMRGRARELTFSELARDQAPQLVKSVLRSTGADFAAVPDRIRLPWSIRLSALGPTLCVRDLAAPAPERLDDFSLSLGDLELF